jgi:BirA family biotin operon repressor/biotin-[acetyl-CoA-carboxylase] ligase
MLQFPSYKSNEIMVTFTLKMDELERMETLFIGQQLIKLHSVDSTNNYAANLIRATKVVEGTVIMADFQDAGRGQRGAEWHSKPGENLLVSFILAPAFLKISEQFYLSKIVAISIWDVMKSFGFDVKIKWPNDIYINEKKGAGVLIENSIQKGKIEKSIVGIGLNVNQKEFSSERFTSISKELNLKHDKMDVLKLLSKSLEKNYFLLKRKDFEKIDKLYNEQLLFLNIDRLYQIGDIVKSGKIKEVIPNGNLKVDFNGNEQLFDLKEISFFPSQS